MEGITIWAEHIIVAVIIATIIEMVVPKGNNKKYIKTVIGVYILFTIISPIIEHASNGEFELKLNKYENYFQETDTYKTMSENFEKSKNQNIEDAYITGIKQDVKSRLKSKNYNVINIKIDAELENEERYGEIKSMEIEVIKFDKEKNTKEENSISINKIEIDTNKKEEKEQGQKLDNNEKLELMEYLSQQYGVNMDNIIII